MNGIFNITAIRKTSLTDCPELWVLEGRIHERLSRFKYPI